MMSKGFFKGQPIPSVSELFHDAIEGKTFFSLRVLSCRYRHQITHFPCGTGDFASEYCQKLRWEIQQWDISKK